MSGHTPGPWPEPEYDNSDFSAASWYDIRGIARVWDEADARLIAAAPELLEVCKAMVLKATRIPSESQSMEDVMSDVSGELERMEAVIAKAEGK